jgi:hypothetical protein
LLLVSFHTVGWQALNCHFSNENYLLETYLSDTKTGEIGPDRFQKLPMQLQEI